MSLVLGPIHHWLFGKIKLQNQIVNEIIALANNRYKGLNLEQGMNQFGTLPTNNLEEIIDVQNIHGWLQECVSTVEYRLAYAVSEILKTEPKDIESLSQLFFEFGKKQNVLDKTSTPKECYKVFNDLLLDGMPCDHANRLIEQDEKHVVWKRELCVHKEYYDGVNGDIKNYYLLRDEFVNGLLYNTNINYKKLDDVTYSIHYES
jgi:hypothetical protein